MRQSRGGDLPHLTLHALRQAFPSAVGGALHV